MSKWSVEITDEAMADIEALDGSQRCIVFKAILKTAQNPLPTTQGGYGKPLGNRSASNITGYLKIKIKAAGLRMVYRLLYEENTMRVIIVSVRDDEIVYRMAAKRIRR